TETTLANFKKVASSEEYNLAKQRLLAADAPILSDNDYEAATDVLDKLEIELSGLVDSYTSAKTNYEDLHPKVETQLETFEDLASDAIYGRAEERKLSAERDADRGDYSKSSSTLDDLNKDLTTQIGLLTTAKSEWDTATLRNKLKQEFIRLEQD